MRVIAMCTVLLLVAAPAVAQEAVIELRSTVVGNQEQPKVLYIIPWQQAERPELIYQPLQSLVDGVFEDIDREEFLRELEYREKVLRSTGSAQ